MKFITDTINKLLKTEIFRFLIVGGLNTFFGGILIPYVIKLFMGNATFSIWVLTLDWPLTIGYLVWFPFAYLLHVYFVFHSKWIWTRFLTYPFTQIPNYGLNQFFLWIFEGVLQLPSLFALALAALFPIPIMFVIVRFVIKKPQKKNDTV